MHILLHFIFYSLYLIFHSSYLYVYFPCVVFSIFALSMERTRLSFHCWLYSLCIVVYVTNKTWNLKLETCETQFCLTVLGQVDADREEDDIFTDICTIVKERLFPSDTNAVGFLNKSYTISHNLFLKICSVQFVLKNLSASYFINIIFLPAEQYWRSLEGRLNIQTAAAIKSKMSKAGCQTFYFIIFFHQ